MKCYVGLGSNLGDRRKNLESAAAALRSLSSNKRIRTSPVYETAAMVPDGAPEDWSLPFLNSVVELDWAESPGLLLTALKGLESILGRKPAPRWAPRIIDLDILACGDGTTNTPHLQIPHAGLFDRTFVLDPLKDLAPGLRLPGSGDSVLFHARKLTNRAPLLMAILNMTPDSFSDGGKIKSPSDLTGVVQKMDACGTHIIDIGAESTRPGAPAVDENEEWGRLAPALELVTAYFKGRLFRPIISIDTRKPAIAEKALRFGADWINDTEGLSNPEMRAVLRESHCGVVIMHSLTVPANPAVVLPDNTDPIASLKEWLNRRLDLLSSENFDVNRVIFDPGVGFGKTASQSLTLINRFDEFASLPLRTLAGHSRKSYLKTLGFDSMEERDRATLSFSKELVSKGADILRIHDFESHARAFSEKGTSS